MAVELVIRDDDLSFFTEVSVLKRCFSDVWDKFPIHFAVIPKVANVKGAIPDEYLDEFRLYPVGDNKELVAFVKQLIKEKKAVIWQHGFTHKNYSGKFELERNDFDLLRKELGEGKRYLEDLFDIKIDTLVAPHDRFSKVAVKAAEQVGFRVISRAYAPLPREFSLLNPSDAGVLLKHVAFYLRYGKSRRMSGRLSVGQHLEQYHYRIQELMEMDLYKLLKFHDGGMLGVTTHHRSMSSELIVLLKDLALAVSSMDGVNAT